MAEIDDRCRALVAELALGLPEDVAKIEPLTGGVASDIARVRLGGRDICMKFALPKLKVAEDWHAPVHRNAAEYAWLRTAAAILPASAVALFGRSKALHGFAMEFISGPDVYLWKAALLEGAPDQGEAAAVGDMLGQIHAASTAPDFDQGHFHNRDDFRALRIEPYLTFTATRHPQVSAQLTTLADMLYEGGAVLVHGDVSPKNILFRAAGPVILDAECATMGDASFDPSFCLNHLILKAVHLPAARTALLRQIGAFWRAYSPHVAWENPAALEARLCRLVPALMLARVDGKSPVEYLTTANRDLVRTLALELIAAPETRLDGLTARIAQAMKEKAA